MLNSVISLSALTRGMEEPEQRSDVGVVVGNDGEQGAVEILGPAYKLPMPISTTNSAWVRGYPAVPPSTLIVVGYSDKKGDEAKNLDISRSRAENVVKALKEKMDLVNVIHAVAMGGQDLFDSADIEKNRVVEVWAVQP